MVSCPNCGSQNDASARFCSECGADLRSLRSTMPQPLQPPPPPPPPDNPFFNQTQNQAPNGGWQTTSGYEQPKKGRRVWLWIVVGILAACLVCCCAFGIWANNGGEDRVNGWLTQISDELTEVAPTPTR